MKLFLKECRKILSALTFWLFVGTLAAMFYSQYLSEAVSGGKLEEPVPGKNNYGTVEKEIPELLMPAAVDSLWVEFHTNNYIAYPIGFYKNVKLNQKKQNSMAGLLAELTGHSKEEILSERNGTPDTAGLSDDADTPSKGYRMEIGDGSGLSKNEDGNYEITLPDPDAQSDSAGYSSGSDSIQEDMSAPLNAALSPEISYTRFREIMKAANKLIGGGSKYDDLYILQFSIVPLTYEEAMENYQAFLSDDHISGAYARVFCDYLGIVAGFIPVFLAAALTLKDRQCGITSLVFSRKISSLRLVLTRFTAMVTMLLIPILLLGLYALVDLNRLYPGFDLNQLAFLQYTFGWLLPSLLISTAVGLFFTELTGTPVAIAIQGIWAFTDMFSGLKQMRGGYEGFVLSPRHNTIGDTAGFINNFDKLLQNRLLFTVLALLLLAAAIYLYEQKRKGLIRESFLPQIRIRKLLHRNPLNSGKVQV